MIYSFLNLFPLLQTCPLLSICQFLLGFPHSFFKSILPNLSTFSFLTNPSPISTLSLNLQSPILLLSMSPLFATLASSSLLLFRGLLTSLLSATNHAKSLASYSNTFLLTLLLQLLLNSTSPLPAQFWNVAVSSGTLLLLYTLSHFLDSLQLFALKIASKFRFSLILLFYLNSIFLVLPPTAKRLNSSFFLNSITISFIFHLKLSILPCPLFLPSPLFSPKQPYLSIYSKIFFL